MGIHGIYKEIGSGVRIALSKLAVQKFEETGRPLRLAIDTSIWLFQIQSSKGGTNPALRTFYYRLLRLMSLSIHPLFVFDGPNRPEFKRNKRVGGGRAQVASIPEFLAKQLLKQFGFPCHLAPGEAEAECALLQREGIVDAVLSEDVDTLMFGSGTTIKNWSPPTASKNKTPTHVDLYEATATKLNSGLDREGMILVALMSGGDYITEGLQGVGPKLACEAARAGFGKDLCSIPRSDNAALESWRARLQHELRTNENKVFRTKHSAVNIPDDFPNQEVLRYYTHPVISNKEKLDRLRQTLSWDADIDYPALRAFTADAFSWTKLGGAKHFIRNLATPLLVRELRLRGQSPESSLSIEATERAENDLVKAIHGRRTHISTDNSSELRVAFKPIDLVPIDLEIEEPDDEPPVEEDDGESVVDDNEETETSSKAKTPTSYNPEALERAWIMETFVRVGIPLTFQDWEASFRDPMKYLAMKHANKAAGKQRSKPSKQGGMPVGALNRFARTMKPGVSRPIGSESLRPSSSGRQEPEPESCASRGTSYRTSCIDGRLPATSLQPSHGRSKSTTSGGAGLTHASRGTDTISLLSSPPRPTAVASSFREGPPTVAKRRRRSPLERSQTSPASFYTSANTSHLQSTNIVLPTQATRLDLTNPDVNFLSQASPSRTVPAKKVRTTVQAPRNRSDAPAIAKDIITLSSSPPRTIDAWLRRSESVTPRKNQHDRSMTGTLKAGGREGQKKNTDTEIRTARIAEQRAVTNDAIAQIDLTKPERTERRRLFPEPVSHLTPADVAKLGSSLDKDQSQLRRRWTKWPVLTQTSGNQPPVKRACGSRADHTDAPNRLPQDCVSQRENVLGVSRELIVQISQFDDGFWEDASASLSMAASHEAGSSCATNFWRLGASSIIDLTKTT